MNGAKINSPSNRLSTFTPARMFFALALAFAADAGQFLLLPFAWTFLESAIDVVAMVVIMRLVGFHWLLLPTFVIEFIPVIDALPTWTACTLAVIAMRRGEIRAAEANPTPPARATISSKPVIEV